jgi:hypothetical protein
MHFAKEVGDKWMHPSGGEQHSRIMLWHQRRRGDYGVAALLEELEKRLA